MKKVTSAALLALRLSWKAALVTLLAAVGVQTFSVYRWLMPGGVPLQAAFGFETMLESAVEPHGRCFMLFLMVFITLRTAETKGSKTVYTMNRLGLSEMQTTLVFGGVFSLYFLLYWAIELGLVYVYFVWYSRFSLVSSNAFMLSCWRSEWLHILLPLGEWWGYLRNAVLCLSFGFCAAFGSRQMRRGKLPLAGLVPALACTVMLPGGIASYLDPILTVLLVLYTAGYWFVLKGEYENEEL